MSRRTLIAAGLAAVVAGGTTAAALTKSSGQAAEPSGVIVAHGEDHLPSTTAAEWVTYADHVVAVTATATREVPPTEEEINRGEGLIGRQVTLRVDDVLWSRQEAPRPAPQMWEYSAVGWQFTGGDLADRTTMVLHDRPRVEAGHRYIVAIAWQGAKCSPGDTPEPAQWRGLGEGSLIPYDGDIIGQGEQEGRAQTAQQAIQAAHAGGPNSGVEEQLAGKNADALVSSLRSATPQQRAFERSTASTCG